MIKQFLFIAVFPLILFAFSENSVIKVSYISADYVYITAGSRDDIQIGDQLKVTRGEKKISLIEVVFTSGYSSSCKVIEKYFDILPDDRVEIFKKSKREKVTVKAKPATRSRKVLTKKEIYKTKSKTRVSGYISLQHYQFLDQSENGYNLSQPSINFKLKIRKLWNRDYNFQLRFRSRYYNRAGVNSFSIPSKEWRYRLYTFYFSFDDPLSRFNYKLGRIISNDISGVGYIDGAILRYHLAESWFMGAFAGFQPELKNSDFQTDSYKYGLFLKYFHKENSGGSFISTLSLSGEYKNSVINRELLYWRTQWNSSKRFSFNQQMELDINRDWRYDKSGKTIALSGLYLSGQYRANDWLSARLSYDNYRNYYSYYYRSLADSLFDDAFRQGVRLSLTVRLPGNYMISGNAGFRKREKDEYITNSYAVRLHKNNFLLRTVSINMRLALFSNALTRGEAFYGSLSKRFYDGYLTSLSYGINKYILKFNESAFKNEWLRFNVQASLPFGLFVGGNYEYTWGSDITGQRIYGEFGYRF